MSEFINRAENREPLPDSIRHEVMAATNLAVDSITRNIEALTQGGDVFDANRAKQLVQIRSAAWKLEILVLSLAQISDDEWLSYRKLHRGQ